MYIYLNPFWTHRRYYPNMDDMTFKDVDDKTYKLKEYAHRVQLSVMYSNC